MKLSWTAPPSGGAEITDYVIQRSTNGTTWPTVERRCVDGDDATPWVGSPTARLYSFRVLAHNSFGDGPFSAIVQATPVWKPAAVSGLTAAVAPATGVGSGQVKLSWTAPADDGGSAISDYRIERSTDGTTWTPVDDGVSSATTATWTG